MTESNFRIFDIHQHVGLLDVPGGSSAGSNGDMSDDYRRRVEVMDRFGFEAAAVMPSLQYPRPNGAADTVAVNDATIAYRDDFSERFPLAFGTVEPLHGEKIGVQEINRLATEKNVDGLVWHHRFQGAFMADSRMHAFLEACEAHGLPALVHVISESNVEAPWGLEALAKAHPDLTFIACDAFSGHNQSREMLGIAERCPNVYFDTAICFPLLRIIEEFVHSFGPERLLFGTDLYLDPPTYHYPHVYTEVREAPDLTDDDKSKIFWGNAERIFPRLQEH